MKTERRPDAEMRSAARLAIAGDKAAQAIVVGEWTELARCLTVREPNRALAADRQQDILTYLWQHLPRYVDGTMSLGAWAVYYARAALQGHRVHSRADPLDSREGGDAACEAPSPARAERAVACAEVARLLAAMPAAQAELVRAWALSEPNDGSVAAAAAKAGVNVRTINRQTLAALAELRTRAGEAA